MLPKTPEMIQAFMNRDLSYDGTFFTAVKTTGIFCRPSCAARKPLLKNIEFFQTQKEALFSGYRPCLRCKPLNPEGGHPDWIKTLLSKIEKEPESRIKDSMIREEGIAPERARRYFTKNFGMTFHAYARARRLTRSFQFLKSEIRMDQVIYDHGYESQSGFRDAFQKLFGETPKTSRGGLCIMMAWIESPIGPLIAGASDEGLCFLEFSDRRMLEKQVKTLRQRLKKTILPGEHELLDQLRVELAEYFFGQRKKFSIPLVFPGTPFEEKVWNELLRIPHGKTVSYEAIAQKIGHSDAQRAVGRANGMNRIAIIIPCHRVVNKNGELGGYGGGVWRKQRLLELERGELKLL